MPSITRTCSGLFLLCYFTLSVQAHPKFSMPGYFYRVSPPASKGQVELFVIDTEMLLAGTTVYNDKLAADGSGREASDDEREVFPAYIAPQNAAERNMVGWLENALAESTARWKIVLGHHALWSGGGSKFEKARALRKLILPALCRHADAYFSGDDHMLEMYTDSCAQVEGALSEPLPTLVSGAGATGSARRAVRELALRALLNPGSTDQVDGVINVAEYARVRNRQQRSPFTCLAHERPRTRIAPQVCKPVKPIRAESYRVTAARLPGGHHDDLACHCGRHLTIGRRLNGRHIRQCHQNPLPCRQLRNAFRQRATHAAARALAGDHFLRLQA